MSGFTIPIIVSQNYCINKDCLITKIFAPKHYFLFTHLLNIKSKQNGFLKTSLNITRSISLYVRLELKLHGLWYGAAQHLNSKS